MRLHNACSRCNPLYLRGRRMLSCDDATFLNWSLLMYRLEESFLG